jgi:SAM-dependent methyltransferase
MATLKAVSRPFRHDVSTGYRMIPPAAAADTARSFHNAWRDDRLPARQRSLVDDQLQRYVAGAPNPPFDALVNILRPLPLTRGTLLEVGCASGYYSQVLAARSIPLSYHGCDYSNAFIHMARRYYPAVAFDVADATALPYSDRAFDVVVSGCCLMHIPEYSQAVSETARVARHYAIFHRTPVLASSPTRYFTKDAYGVRTVEIHFNEGDLVRLFARHRLDVIDIRTIFLDWRGGDALMNRTYLCSTSSS